MDLDNGRAPEQRYVPPDPGGRSRILLWILVTCVVGALVAFVIFMLALRSATPTPTPQQQPAGRSALTQGGASRHLA